MAIWFGGRFMVCLARSMFLVVVMVTLAAGALAETRTEEIETRLGTIVGIQAGDVKVFRGIRYGEPPIDERRFLPPVAAKGWDGTLDATGFPNRAMQPPTATILGPKAPGPLNEDCLFLNIYTPSTEGGNRPVLFWIHGGSLTTGTANEYDGTVLAEQGDVVVVAINYRLGLFGFLDLSELGDEFAGSASNGFRDQILALKWVRDNITDYGGDPNNVTIFGESAGGQSVFSILASPSADGLYHKAISNSGSYANMPPAQLVPKLTTRLKVDSEGLIDALRGMDARKLLSTQIAMQELGGGGVDGVVVTRSTVEAIAERGAAGVPLVAGSNLDEGTLFSVIVPPGFYGLVGEVLAMVTMEGSDPSAYLTKLREAYPDDSDRKHFERVWVDFLRRPAIEAAEQATAAGPGGWLYRFDYASGMTVRNIQLGATHASEIAFTFNTFVRDDTQGVMFHDRDDPVARKLAEHWSNTVIMFARTGDPNGAGLPAWPRYSAEDRRSMILDAHPRIVADIDTKHREMWRED